MLIWLIFNDLSAIERIYDSRRLQPQLLLSARPMGFTDISMTYRTTVTAFAAKVSQCYEVYRYFLWLMAPPWQFLPQKCHDAIGFAESFMPYRTAVTVFFAKVSRCYGVYRYFYDLSHHRDSFRRKSVTMLWGSPIFLWLMAPPWQFLPQKCHDAMGVGW